MEYLKDYFKWKTLRKFLIFIVLYIVLVYSSQPITILHDKIIESYYTIFNNNTNNYDSYNENFIDSQDKTIAPLLKNYVTYNPILKNFVYDCLNFYSLLLPIEREDKTLYDWYYDNNITKNIPNNTYCLTSYTNLWLLPPPQIESLLFDYKNFIQSKNEMNFSSVEFFIDGRNEFYYLLNVLTPIVSSINAPKLSINNEVGSSSSKKKKMESSTSKMMITNEKVIIDILNKIDNKGKTCICPLFIGINANISFLYKKDQESWSILHEPYIYHNNSISGEIETSIVYAKDSLLYHNHKNYYQYKFSNKTKKTEEEEEEEEEFTSIHYSVFSIEFTSFGDIRYDNINGGSSSEEDEDENRINMKKMSRTLMSYYTDKGLTPPFNSNKGDNNIDTLFYVPLVQRELIQKKRHKISLSDENAICFIHCYNINK
jgi:hypothetical protein